MITKFLLIRIASLPYLTYTSAAVIMWMIKNTDKLECYMNW